MILARYTWLLHCDPAAGYSGEGYYNLLSKSRWVFEITVDTVEENNVLDIEETW